jgi:hypothetical protein
MLGKKQNDTPPQLSIGGQTNLKQRNTKKSRISLILIYYIKYYYNLITFSYYLSTPVCPPGFSDPLLWARRVHGPAAAFNVYKSPPTPLLDHLLL